MINWRINILFVKACFIVSYNILLVNIQVEYTKMSKDLYASELFVLKYTRERNVAHQENNEVF